MTKFSSEGWLGGPDGRGLESLTSAGLVRLDHFPSPPELQPFVTTLFTLCCDEQRISDVFPAGVGYLAILLRGRGTLRFVTGRVESSHPETLLAPTSAAVLLEAEGPLHMVGAALSPLGWAALTGLHAGDHSDTAYEAGAMLGADCLALGARLRAMPLAAPEDGAALAGELARFIAPRLRPLSRNHVALVGKVAEWLSSSFDPDVAALQASSGYSDRQLQRLVVRFFGGGPKQLARKYRALRVAALLQSDKIETEREAELLDLFYDQSHMIREIRRFLGRTPNRLGRGEAPVLEAATDLRNYREFKPNVARIPGD